MDLPITLRQERRLTPRPNILLRQAPLNLAANPALLADLQAAVTAAERDPRAVSCLFQMGLIDLSYARDLLRVAREAAERAKEDCDDYGHDEASCGNANCLPAKQVPQ